MLGLILVYYRGLPILAIGAIGLLGGYLYTGGPRGYKYLALGDVLVFVLMGPLSIVGTYLALTGEMSLALLLASLPVGSLVAAIMAVDNHRDAAGFKTLSSIIGFKASRLANLVLPVSAYVFVGLMALFGVLSAWTLLVFLSLPLALRNLKVIGKSDEEGARAHLHSSAHGAAPPYLRGAALGGDRAQRPVRSLTSRTSRNRIRAR